MSKEIGETITKIISLLQFCGYEEQATWFKEKLAQLDKSTKNNDVFVQVANEIQNVLAGQGSFTDLPLSPPDNSNLSRDEIRHQQWGLAKRLDALLQTECEKVK